MKIDKELIDHFTEKNVIPFIGAGFSIACGLPSWEKLIKRLLDKFNINKNKIDKKNDLLRIAEYLKILNNNSIGPIRLEIQNFFNEVNANITDSDPHLHLASLNVPIIYTTNYDNLIERTFEYLDIPYNKIVTPTDIVETEENYGPEIVKFHGSFEHEEEIVLTESDYFKRLELESPMDIKLRGDILGKTVLFMGYSFSDFNIRYLWFKLNSMMEEINDKNKPNSYILLPEPNEMKETLLKKVGIIPIYLSRFSGDNLTERLSNFLEEIIVQVNKNFEWEFENQVVATNTQIEKMIKAFKNNDNDKASKYLWLLNNSIFGKEQIDFLQKKYISNNNESALFFKLLEKTTPKLRKDLIKLIDKLRNNYNLDCLYDILIISFFRYPEIREYDQLNDYRNWIEFIQYNNNLSRKGEFILLTDAVIWTKFNKNLKKDTILFYIYGITQYFKNKKNKIISRNNYKDLTPSKVINYIRNEAEWIPGIDYLNENFGVGRLLESVGGKFENKGEFKWRNFSQKKKSVLEEIF